MSMNVKMFPKEYLTKTLGLPFNAIENKIVERTRWSLIHEIVFKDLDGKYYHTTYEDGATEMQEEAPWEYDDEVECIEVKRIKRYVEVWEYILNE